MIGYGMAKAAVHQLTKSLAGQDGGLPNNSVVATILPWVLNIFNYNCFCCLCKIFAQYLNFFNKFTCFIF